MLQGLVKTDYNVYMTFYGSEFITVLFYDLQRRNILQDFAAFDSSVSVHLVRGSCFFFFFFLPSFHSLSLYFILFFLSKGVSSSDSLILSDLCLTWRLSIELDSRFYGWFGETLKFQMVFGLPLEVPIYNIHKQKEILPINAQVFIRTGDFFPLYVSQQRWMGQSSDFGGWHTSICITILAVGCLIPEQIS